MKDFKLLGILLVTCVRLNAQSFDWFAEASLEMKYASYRYRLVGDNFDYNKYPGFLRIGSGPGFSMPAITRSKNTNCSWLYYNPNTIWEQQYIENDFSCANQGLCTGYGQDPFTGELKFQDNPLIELGKYLGVLGTEWLLLTLSNSGGSTDEQIESTELELYYALETLNRLDLYAEELYNLSPALDGFLARADVPQDFAMNYFGDNYDLTEATSCCNAGDNNGMGNKCEVTNPIESMQRNVMSQDEAYGVLEGLRIVQSCIPNGVFVNGMNLSLESQSIAVRILEYMRGDVVGRTDWLIEDPLGNFVCRGHNTQAFSFALAKTYKKITGDEFQNFVSSTIGFEMWNWFEGTGIFPQNENMVLGIAAISSTWFGENMDKQAYLNDEARFSLMNCFLENREPHDPPAIVSSQDSYHFWLDYLDAFNSASEEAQSIPCNPLPTNAYEDNGLDYMLAFNLFRLVFHGSPKYYLGNLTNRVIEATFPMSLPIFDPNSNTTYNVSYGSNDYPLVLKALDTYDLNDVTLNEHANVSIYAQNEINLNEPIDVDNIGDGSYDVQADMAFDCIPNYFELPNDIVLFSARHQYSSSSSSSSSNIPNQSSYKKTDNLINVYPNPANNFVSVTVLGREEYSLAIIDQSGKDIQRLSLTQSTNSINISKLSPGFYLLHFTDKKGEFLGRTKLIIQ